MVTKEGLIMPSVQIATTRSQSVRPKVVVFMGKVECKNNPKQFGIPWLGSKSCRSESSKNSKASRPLQGILAQNFCPWGQAWDCFSTQGGWCQAIGGRDSQRTKVGEKQGKCCCYLPDIRCKAPGIQLTPRVIKWGCHSQLCWFRKWKCDLCQCVNSSLKC